MSEIIILKYAQTILDAVNIREDSVQRWGDEYHIYELKSVDAVSSAR